MAYPAEVLRLARRRIRTRARAIRVRWGALGGDEIETVDHRSIVPAQSSDPFDPERAFRLLKEQCGHGPRIPGSDGHRRVQSFLIEELGSFATEIAVQRWRQFIFRGCGARTIVPMTNILARIGEGSEPDLLLGAHYDTRPLADRDPDPVRRSEPVPGANDGASGVAVVLEAARVLAASGPTLVVALFDGEDLGDHYYGSEVFARSLRKPENARWRGRYGMIADMVGKDDLHCCSELGSMRAAPELWRTLRGAVDRLDLAHRFDGPLIRVNDDHVPLIRAGIPSILLIDYAYPEWHTTRDVPERCSPASLEAVGRVIVDLAEHVR